MYIDNQMSSNPNAYPVPLSATSRSVQGGYFKVPPIKNLFSTRNTNEQKVCLNISASETSYRRFMDLLSTLNFKNSEIIICVIKPQQNILKHSNITRNLC